MGKMSLTAAKVLELRERYGLIENLADRELENPEGVGLDIRFGDVYELEGSGFLHREERKTPETEKIVEAGSGDTLTLEPGDYVLVKTLERVDVPGEKIEVDGEETHVWLDVYPRSTLQRSGIYFMGTKTDPGYSGELVFTLANLGPSAFEIQEGARIANLVFKTATGELERAYEGQWNEGRVETGGTEEQV
ncbi:MAG: deoxycytidine deaminase [Candidatus Nanohaloarchaea archaeon]